MSGINITGLNNLKAINRKSLVIFVAVVLIIVRLWKINSVPISLFGDEVDVGLQAYSILTTGKDYMGDTFPVMFHSFSEYRLPMQLYLDAPFIKIFGLNAWGVRFPSVLFGIISIISFYFLAEHFFDKRIALISSIFLAISPWHFMFSRQANDAGFLLPFVISGTLFFIKGLTNFKLFAISAVIFSFGIYAYAISSLFIPLYVIALLIIYRNEVLKIGIMRLIEVAILVAVILAPYIYKSFDGTTTSRFSYITVATSQDVASEVISKRLLARSKYTRLFYNKASVLFTKVIDNYSQSFSTNFLFTQGDPNPRQSINYFGEFYHFDVIFLIIGFIVIVNIYSKTDKKKRKIYLALLLWLLLAPIPSSLTKDGGRHASRLILMLPPLILVSAIGFNKLLTMPNTLKNNLVKTFIYVFMVVDISMFFFSYFLIWPKESWRYWQYGYKDTVKYVKSVDSNYQRVFLNNTYEPMLPRFLFWYGYDMNLFHKQFTDDKHIENIYPGFSGFKLGDKFYFGELVKPIERLAQDGNLVVASAEKDATNPNIFATNPNLELLHFTNSPTEVPIFYIFTKYSGN